MAPHSQKQEVYSDDIDLLMLTARAIAFIKKYRWLFLSAAILGISWGIWRYTSLPVKYKSSLLVRPLILTNQEEIQIIANWNELLKKKEYSALCQTFNCNEDIVYNLLEIKADEIQKVFTPTNPNAFSVEVLVKTNNILPALQQGILYGFENSGYVPQKLAARESRFIELIAKVEIDIQQLDSTKKTMTALLRGQGNSSSSVIVDGSSLNKQWLEMNEKILYLKEELRFNKAVQLLQGFQAYRQPVRQSALLLIAIGLVVAIALAYFMALIIELNQQLKARSVLSV